MNSQYSSTHSSTEPLPFCLDTSNSTSNDAHPPSGRCAIPCSHTNRCHSNSDSPASSASATASGPAVVTAGAAHPPRGSCEPIGTPSGEIVELIRARLLRLDSLRRRPRRARHRPQLLQRPQQMPRSRPIARVELPRELPSHLRGRRLLHLRRQRADLLVRRPQHVLPPTTTGGIRATF